MNIITENTPLTARAGAACCACCYCTASLLPGSAFACLAFAMKAGANSGKKQRLKLQVARVTQRSTSQRLPADTVTIESQPAHDFRLKGVPKDLFTVFHVREAAYEVEKRIVAARRPLEHRSMVVEEGRLYQELLAIPTRTPWTASTKARKAHEVESAGFESYLSSVYSRYPPSRLNHFEHNVGVWRQLWRVCELSDVLLLSADVRHPMFHFPPSLYRHVVHDLGKPLLLVLNKVDLVDATTLDGWVAWFRRRYPGLEVLCFSSFPNGEAVVSDHVDVAVKRKDRRREGGRRQQPAGVRDLMDALERKLREKLDRGRRVEEAKETGGKAADEAAVGSRAAAVPGALRVRGRTREKALPKAHAESAEAEGKNPGDAAEGESVADGKEDTVAAAGTDPSAALPTAPKSTAPRTSKRMARLTHAVDAALPSPTPVLPSSAPPADVPDQADGSEEEDELVTLHAPAPARPSRHSILVVGVIGHPNCGKSSLINGLFGRPVVSASDTPGHTKHLQTLALTPTIAIVDSPGLVFPAVDMPRELQVLCGIFPISQLREPYSAIAYLAERVPLERIYGLRRAQHDDGPNAVSGARHAHGHDDDDEEEEVREVGRALNAAEQDVGWSAWELCEAFARQRGFTVKGSNGRWDTHRAANAILHDVLHGVVVFNFKAPTALVE